MNRETILGCAQLAAVKVGEIHGVLDQALAGADAKAALDRQVKGHKGREYGCCGCGGIVLGSRRVGGNVQLSAFLLRRIGPDFCCC